MNDGPEMPMPRPLLSLEGALRELINSHSAENGSDTPDFILAQYLIGCINLLDAAVRSRESWYGRGYDPVSEPPPRSMT